MSYSFELTFAEAQMRSEGAALKYGKDLVKKIATDPELARQQVENNRWAIAAWLHMADIQWNTPEERKKALSSKATNMAFRTAADSIFSQRIIYWPQHDYMVAIVGSNIPDKLKTGMSTVFFQNGSDQDYPFSEWSDKIDLFVKEKGKIRSMKDEELRSKLDWDCDLDYIRRSLLYQNIFNQLALDNWLYKTKDENGFRTVEMNAIVCQEMEFELITRIRAFVNTWDTFW